MNTPRSSVHQRLDAALWAVATLTPYLQCQSAVYADLCAATGRNAFSPHGLFEYAKTLRFLLYADFNRYREEKVDLESLLEKVDEWSFQQRTVEYQLLPQTVAQRLLRDMQILDRPWPALRDIDCDHISRESILNYAALLAASGMEHLAARAEWISSEALIVWSSYSGNSLQVALETLGEYCNEALPFLDSELCFDIEEADSIFAKFHRSVVKILDELTPLLLRTASWAPERGSESPVVALVQDLHFWKATQSAVFYRTAEYLAVS